MLTDPPYNARKDYGPGTDDSKPWPDYCQWIVPIIEALELVSSGPVFVFVSVNGMLEISTRKRPRHVCVWDKPMAFSPRMGGSCFLPHWEPCLIYGKTWGEGGRVPNYHMSDVWHHNTAVRNGHPCPKPESLLMQIVGSLPAQTIFDPFMGSGTTGVACMNLSRKFIGAEIEPKYFDIACERIDQAQRQLRICP